MKYVLFEQKKIILGNNQNFVENKTEILKHVLKHYKFPCCLNIYNEFVGDVFYVHLKVDFLSITLHVT
jgi:hypothetical protein